MQRHADKLQRAKEEAALKAMKRLLPDMSPAVWVLALEECNWDVEPAVILLNQFTTANGSEILRIQKVCPSLPCRPHQGSSSCLSSANDAAICPI